MSTEDAERILQPLRRVNAARARQRADEALGHRVKLIKAYQAARFRFTYADLLDSPRHQAATRFFLTELYGPGDFVERDQQFERIVPTLVRLFPKNVCRTVQELAELHALSEDLDEQMATHLPPEPVSPVTYARAWQHVGRADDRQRQIDLATTIGRDLDSYTRNRLLRHSLRMMRVPAATAGLGSLQNFLEAGFDAFAQLKGASEFLGTVSQREGQFCAALFNTDLQRTEPGESDSNPQPVPDELTQHLPN